MTIAFETPLRAIGVDPGPTPGVVLLELSPPGLLRIEVVQCSSGVLSQILEALLCDQAQPLRTLLQVERFVVGRRSGRSGTPGAGETTRNLIGEIYQVWRYADDTGLGPGSALLERSASNVKPWATDLRLDAAGLIEPTKGMRHARDAARHALFVACRDGHLPDPLSKEFPR